MRQLRAVRILVGAYAAVWLAVRLPHHLDLAALPDRRWRPVGVLASLDLPPAAWLARAIAVAALPLAVAFAAGWRQRALGPLFAAALLFVTTYASSWGQLFHTENLLVLHVLVLVLAARADAELVLRLLAVVTVAAYVASGIAKLRGAGWAWVAGDVLRDQVAFDNARKAVIGSATSPIGVALVRHAWVFTPMAVATLAVELGAPVALAGRRVAAAWSVAAWGFHVGVLALMAIGFPYQLSGVAFAALLPVDRLPLASGDRGTGRARRGARGARRGAGRDPAPARQPG